MIQRRNKQIAPGGRHVAKAVDLGPVDLTIGLGFDLDGYTALKVDFERTFLRNFFCPVCRSGVRFDMHIIFLISLVML